MSIFDIATFFKPNNMRKAFDDASERRSASDSAVPLSSIKSWPEFFGYAHDAVSPETAMKYSAVYACVKVISETLAMLPREVYSIKNKQRLIDEESPLAKLIATEPSEYQTWFNLIESWIAQALRRGNGYILIERDGFGRPVSFRHLEDGMCAPYYNNSNEKRELYYHVSYMGRFVEPRDILHITCLGNDGVIGKSPITQAAEAIGLGISAQKTMKKVYDTNFKTKPTIELDGELSNEEFIRFKEQMTLSLRNDEVLLLENGMKASSLTINPQDAETLATRQFQIEDISRFYRVPLHMLNSLLRSTNNNIEQQSQEFVTYCILPWVVKITEELSRKLVMPSERGRKIITLDTDFIMMADLKTWAEFSQKMFLSGSMSPNDIRQSRGYNRSENPAMDKYYVQQQVVPIELTEELAKQNPPKNTNSQS